MTVISSRFTVRSSKGYTLVEMLVVVSILVTVGSLVAGVLYTTIRGSNKTQVNNAVAQNGNHAVSVMTNFLVNANALISFERTNGEVRTNCVSASRFQGKAITIEAADAGTVEFRCSDTGDTDRVITSNSASLIDNSAVQLTPDACFIYCSQPDLFSPPRIDIEFELEQIGTSEFADQVSSATFKSSATLRNYGLNVPPTPTP